MSNEPRLDLYDFLGRLCDLDEPVGYIKWISRDISDPRDVCIDKILPVKEGVKTLGIHYDLMMRRGDLHMRNMECVSHLDYRRSIKGSTVVLESLYGG